MNKIFFVCFLFTLFGAFGGFFFKKAAGSADSIVKLIYNPFIYIGGAFYLIGAILNIWVLRYLKYTVVLPITSITYIWTIIISYFILKEKITVRKFIGLTLILMGVAFLSLT